MQHTDSSNASLCTGDDSEIADCVEQRSDDPFPLVPWSIRRRVYGVPYVELQDATGGHLWVTRHGWPYVRHLDASRWYADRTYQRRGKRISDGSGAVYRVPSTIPGERTMDLVVKFSRMSQDLQLQVASDFPGGVPRFVSDTATFSDPFQEFGLLEELRNSTFGPSHSKILTKRPLAIYSPGRHFDAWQLGRDEDRFRQHQRQLAEDQADQISQRSVQLSINRQYILLFQWVDGTDAADMVRAGRL